MRLFEITFYRGGQLVSRTVFQGVRPGQAYSFARMLLGCRNADRYQVEEV